MDIPHILYSTVGNDFEKFLGPWDLLTMSKVSKTAREGDLARKFRHLLEVTYREFEIFKKNNRNRLSMDSFFQNIPLGVIYKNHVLEEGTEFNMLLDHFNCNTKTRRYISIELGQLPDGLSWAESIFQASMRGREDIVELLYNKFLSPPVLYKDKIGYRYYSASKRLVDLFVENERAYVDVMSIFEGYPRDAYAINEVDDKDELKDFIFLVTCFQEQDVFRNYYLKYHNKIPERIESILRDVSLKYNIDRYDARLQLY